MFLKRKSSITALFLALVGTSLIGMEPAKRSADKNDTTSNQALKKQRSDLTDAQKETLLTKIRSKCYAHFSKPMKALFESVVLGDADGVVEALRKIKNTAAIKTNKDGMNPIHLAALHGHTPIVNQLLDFGLDCDTLATGRDSLNSYGPTPLFFAVYSGNLETIRILLARGASIDTTDRSKFTALHRAVQGPCRRNCSGIIKELIDYGADTEARTAGGSTPLFLAAQHTHMKVAIRSLLERGAQVNAANIKGEMPLQTAIDCGSGLEVLKELLRWGARYTPEDFRFILAAFGQFDFLLLAMLGDRDLIQAIKSPFIDQAAVNEALIFAVAQRQPKLVKLLLSNGAQPEEALQMLNIIMNHDTFSPAERATYQTIHGRLMQRMTLVEIILRRASLRDNLISSEQLPQELKERVLAQKIRRILHNKYLS